MAFLELPQQDEFNSVIINTDQIVKISKWQRGEEGRIYIYMIVEGKQEIVLAYRTKAEVDKAYATLVQVLGVVNFSDAGGSIYDSRGLTSL